MSLLKQVYNNNDIPPIETADNITTDDREKAQPFNKFFLSVTTIDDTNVELPPKPPIMNINTVDSLYITKSDVKDQLKILDTNKSYGPDGISPKLLKEGGDTTCKSLQFLFNESLRLAQFQKQWKFANVTPIFKKGSKETFNNYRPVSLLNRVGKIV